MDNRIVVEQQNLKFKSVAATEPYNDEIYDSKSVPPGTWEQVKWNRNGMNLYTTGVSYKGAYIT
jgi:hypothetical protein